MEQTVSGGGQETQTSVTERLKAKLRGEGKAKKKRKGGKKKSPLMAIHIKEEELKQKKERREGEKNSVAGLKV